MIRLITFFTFLILIIGCGVSKKHVLRDGAIDSSPNVVLYENTTETRIVSRPEIAINSGNPETILLSSYTRNLHRSRNSGNTWTTSMVGDQHLVVENPLILADEKGGFHYFQLSAEQLSHEGSDCPVRSILHYTSQSDGLLWSSPENIYTADFPLYNLKAAFQADNGTIYLTWAEAVPESNSTSSCMINLQFMRYDKKSKAWTEPISLDTIAESCNECSKKTINPTLITGTKGEVYIACEHNGAIFFHKSFDDGTTWSTREGPMDFTLEQPLVRNHSSKFQIPILLYDRSRGPYTGSLYMVFAVRNEEDSGIYISRSSDKGETWSDAHAIYGTSEGEFLAPAASIDQADGQLYILCYTARGEDRATFDVSLNYSQDAGKTWTRKNINEAPVTLNPIENHALLTTVHAYQGQVRPVWTEYGNGGVSISTALIHREPAQ